MDSLQAVGLICTRVCVCVCIFVSVCVCVMCIYVVLYVYCKCSKMFGHLTLIDTTKAYFRVQISGYVKRTL